MPFKFLASALGASARFLQEQLRRNNQEQVRFQILLELQYQQHPPKILQAARSVPLDQPDIQAQVVLSARQVQAVSLEHLAALDQRDQQGQKETAEKTDPQGRPAEMDQQGRREHPAALGRRERQALQGRVARREPQERQDLPALPARPGQTAPQARQEKLEPRGRPVQLDLRAQPEPQA